MSNLYAPAQASCFDITSVTTNNYLSWNNLTHSNNISLNQIAEKSKLSTTQEILMHTDAMKFDINNATEINFFEDALLVLHGRKIQLINYLIGSSEEYTIEDIFDVSGNLKGRISSKLSLFTANKNLIISLKGKVEKSLPQRPHNLHFLDILKFNFSKLTELNFEQVIKLLSGEKDIINYISSKK